MDEEAKLDDIIECDQEQEETKNGTGSCESDTDSKSSNPKLQNLKKQNGIDMKNSLDQGN